MHVPLEVFRTALVVMALSGPHQGQPVYQSILSIPADDADAAMDKCEALGIQVSDAIGSKYTSIICRQPKGLPA